jgi:hypothetical protein
MQQLVTLQQTSATAAATSSVRGSGRGEASRRGHHRDGRSGRRHKRDVKPYDDDDDCVSEAASMESSSSARLELVRLLLERRR